MEPLAEVDVNVPGVMATLDAPDVAQLSVALEPESMLVGAAEKEVTVGTELFPEDATVAPQATSPKQAARMRTAETTICEGSSLDKLTFFSL